MTSAPGREVDPHRASVTADELARVRALVDRVAAQVAEVLRNGIEPGAGAEAAAALHGLSSTLQRWELAAVCAPYRPESRV
jgi:site-specific recombinase